MGKRKPKKRIAREARETVPWHKFETANNALPADRLLHQLHKPNERADKARLRTGPRARPELRGELKIMAAILDLPVIEKILTHLGLQARAPPRSPARGPQLLRSHEKGRLNFLSSNCASS